MTWCSATTRCHSRAIERGVPWARLAMGTACHGHGVRWVRLDASSRCGSCSHPPRARLPTAVSPAHRRVALPPLQRPPAAGSSSTSPNMVA
eukprot:242478-Prymnesium_polylepis.2